LSIYDNVIITNGLVECFTGEVVTIIDTEGTDTNCLGVILTLDGAITRIVLLKGSQKKLSIGYTVVRTGKYVKTRVGFSILGLAVTTLGSILYGNVNTTKLLDLTYIDIGRSSPTIIERESIATPFLTGIAAIDCFIPIGCGQRELIIGDLNTGKTSLAITVILNQSYIINSIDYA
jgi:F-type H+/Na+-transporting ATPase subunit alpha